MMHITETCTEAKEAEEGGDAGGGETERGRRDGGMVIIAEPHADSAEKAQSGGLGMW